jgi:hypothetical protein
MLGTAFGVKPPWRPARPHSVPPDRLEEVAEEAFLRHVRFVRALRFVGVATLVVLASIVLGIWSGRIAHRAPGPVEPVVSAERETIRHDLREGVRRFLFGDR